LVIAMQMRLSRFRFLSHDGQITSQ